MNTDKPVRFGNTLVTMVNLIRELVFNSRISPCMLWNGGEKCGLVKGWELVGGSWTVFVCDDHV